MSYSDDNLIEQTKRQIQSLVAEIAQLTKQSLTPGEFYGEFLNRVVTALAAIGGAVWTTADDGRLTLQYQSNIQQTGLLQDEEKQKRHSRLLYNALGNEAVRNGEGLLVPPHTGFGEDGEAANPTDFLLVIGPLRTELAMVGLVEIYQRSEAAHNVQEGYLRFLLQMCELAADYLKSHQLRHYSDRQVLWARLEEFTRMAHSSLDPIDTAYTIANEGRRLIECDRVSVAIRRGNHCKIEAVSGQDVFDKRSNTVRLLGRLASAVVATGDPVWYAGDTRDMAPQVEDAVQEYVDEAHSKMIAVLPLGRPKPDQEVDIKDREEAEPPIGALIIEQIEDNRVAPAMAQRVEVVCKHSATAMANAMEHQNLFLMPVWRAIGKSTFIVKARTLPKTLSIGGAVIALLIILIVWPADFDLHCNGTLEPVVRRDVFAAVDGEVIEIGDKEKGEKVEHKSTVHKGQTLVKLRNLELDAQYEEIDGKVKSADEQRRTYERAIGDNKLPPADQLAAPGKLAEAEVMYNAYMRERALIEKKRKDRTIISPIDGVVVTWTTDLERLMNRPVQRGQSLMKVADPTGQWQLELQMPDDRMGFINRAEKIANENGEALKVRYFLKTDAGTRLDGEVMEIQQYSDVHNQEDGSVVLIRVKIDKNKIDPAKLRQGATVSAKVHCGRRSLGYVWFHDLLAFIQAKVFFRYF